LESHRHCLLSDDESLAQGAWGMGVFTPSEDAGEDLSRTDARL